MDTILDAGLDPRLTFETYVIGAANRLACAAARRVAESPGTSYNPLFVYSASGLGKTHLVMAIGHHARRVLPELSVVYDSLESFMGQAMAAIEAGERDAFRARVAELDLLLLDDVQFLAGGHRTQEELLRVLDTLSARGGQVVLTSDRPPPEIDRLDERLLSRFSGGLIVDIGVPDFETRVAIVQLNAEERGQELGDGVAEELARIAFGNVRELQGALNRLIAAQELEERVVAAEEVEALLGLEARAGAGGEFGDFLAEISDTVDAVVTRSPAERRIADSILRWEGEGFRTRRLEQLLAETGADDDVDAVIDEYEADAERLREIADEIEALDPDAPERSRLELLRDPDRRDEAEALLGGVRERTQPLPPPPPGPALDELPLPADGFAVRAVIAAADAPGERYNPLMVHGPSGSGKSVLLAALGRRLAERYADRPLAFLDGPSFSAELIQALERNRVESWRARYRRARAFLLDDVDALAHTERAQEELFHLFEVLQRAGALLAFTSSRPPSELDGLEDRLRTRLESGLVVELSDEPVAPTETPEEDLDTDVSGPANAGGRDSWFLSRERVVWEWPYAEDSLVEEVE